MSSTPLISERSLHPGRLVLRADPPQFGAARAEAGSRSDGNSLWLALTVFAVRASYGLVVQKPRVFFDEPSQLAVARFLSGRGRWGMTHAPTYQPGLGTLLVPINVIVSDPAVVYRIALLLNSLFAALSALVLVAVARELRILGGVAAYVVAAMVAVAPAVTPLSASGWADPAVTLTFLIVTLGVLRLARAPSSLTVGLTTAAGCAGYLFHARMLPTLGTAACLTVALSASHGRRLLAIGGFVGTVAGGGAVYIYSKWIFGQLWHRPSATNSVDTIVGHLADPLAVAKAVLGQLWYLNVAWVGAPVVAVAVVAGSLRTGRTPCGLERRSALLLTTLTVPMLLTSTVFMAGREERADFLVYGRYNDDIVWPIVMIAAAELWRLRGIGLVKMGRIVALPVGLTLGHTLLITVLIGEDLRRLPVTNVMVSGLAAFTAFGSINPARIGLVACGLVSVVGVALSSKRRAGPMAIGLIAVVILFGNLRTLIPRSQDEARAGNSPIGAVAAVVPNDQPLGFRLSYSGYFVDPTFVARLAQEYQFWLPHHQFVFVDDDDQPPKFTLSVPDDPHFDGRAEVVWADPRAHYVLWELSE